MPSKRVLDQQVKFESKYIVFKIKYTYYVGLTNFLFGLQLEIALSEK